MHKISQIFVFFSIISSLLINSAYTQSAAWLTPDYVSLIQNKINPHFIYPKEAITKGWEGIVKVRITLTANGQITKIDVAKSSGYPLLDTTAMLAIKDASPYPFPKDIQPKKEVEIIIPVRFEQPKVAGQPTQKLAPSVTPKKPLTLSAEPAKIKRIISTPIEIAPLDELEYFVHQAIQHNQPMEVAREEVELAQLKVMDAQRNLFPALKISGFNTEGKFSQLDFEEWETKLEATQPLFNGNKLINTVKQNKVNLDISKKNYTWLKDDLTQKTESAYYNLVAAKMHLELKESLLKETKEILGKIEKLSTAGMVIPLEAASAASWFEQIQFQAENIKQELAMAELTFKQVLNIKELSPIKTTQLLQAKKLNTDLPACIEAALKHHPEAYLSRLLVKFNDYGQKIKESESKAFSVDFISSYGYYRGHFKTDAWGPHSNNWFTGIKVSKPWGPSTLNSSYTSKEERPRFGVTSSTRISDLSAELGLLDNMKRVSEKKNSDISLRRSLSDLNETTKKITFAVQDAFLNYQKAILELKASQLEMKFRRNETEVIKMRSMAGETTLSSTMEALFTLSEAQTKYVQALTHYHLSLANLKKATAYSIPL